LIITLFSVTILLILFFSIILFYTREDLKYLSIYNNSMNTLINTINNYFYEMMQDRIDPEKHLFFTSIKWWKNAYNQWSNDIFDVKKPFKEKNLDLSPL
jgi:hypothetical protein